MNKDAMKAEEIFGMISGLSKLPVNFFFSITMLWFQFGFAFLVCLFPFVFSFMINKDMA